MPRIPTPLIVVILGGLLVIAVATLKPAPKPLTIEVPPPPKVDVVLANPSTQALPVHSQGTVEPRREINLVAEVSGRITQTDRHFMDGAFVKAGKSLVTIDPRNYELALLRADARVADAEQLLATEKGRTRQAKREWRDLGNAEANALFLRQPQLAAAEAQLQSAKADRDQAQLDLERTSVSVPFDGRIRETQVDLGQYVTPGTLIASVYDTSVAEIRLPLTDRQIALLDLPLGFNTQVADADSKLGINNSNLNVNSSNLNVKNSNQGPEVTISGVIAGQQHQWQGRITRTDASLDTRSRLYYAIAEVQDPFLIVKDPFLIDHNTQGSNTAPLIVGLFVEATIRGRELKDVITIPHNALFKRNHIYTLDKDNRAQEKTVSLLHTDGKQAWIQGDLHAGDAIVVGRQNYLSEGMVVSPQEPAAANPAEHKTVAGS